MPTKTFYPVEWDSNTEFQNPQNVCAEDENYMTKGLEGYLLAGNLVITDFGIVEGLPEDAEIVSLTLQTKRNLQYTRIPEIYENSAKITMYGEESHSNFFYNYDTPGGDPTLMSPSGWLNVSGTLTATANPEIQGLAKYEAGLSPVTYHVYGRLGGSTPYPETTIAVDFIRLVVEYKTAETSGKMSAVSGASLGGTRYVFHELDGGSPLLGSLDFDGEIDGGAPSTTAQEFEGEIDGGNPRTILIDFDFIVNLAGEIAGETALSGSATSESENPPVPVPASGAISVSSGMEAGTDLFSCIAGEAMMESGGKSLAEVGKHLSGYLEGESEVAARAYSGTETSIRITSSAGVKGRALVERLTKGDSFGTSGAEGNGIIKPPPVLVGRITPDGVLSIKGVLIEGAESIRFTSSGDLHAGSLVEGEEGISIEGTEIRVKVFHESAL